MILCAIRLPRARRIKVYLDLGIRHHGVHTGRTSQLHVTCRFVRLCHARGNSGVGNDEVDFVDLHGF